MFCGSVPAPSITEYLYLVAGFVRHLGSSEICGRVWSVQWYDEREREEWMDGRLRSGRTTL